MSQLSVEVKKVLNENNKDKNILSEQNILEWLGKPCYWYYGYRYTDLLQPNVFKKGLENIINGLGITDMIVKYDSNSAGRGESHGGFRNWSINNSWYNMIILNEKTGKEFVFFVKGRLGGPMSEVYVYNETGDELLFFDDGRRIVNYKFIEFWENFI